MTITNSSPTPIAVVGMSCRLPGQVRTIDEFWTLISRGRDAWCPIPSDRMSSAAYYHPDPQRKGCFNLKGGYFLQEDLSQFDAPFFHITQQEAIAMDPQQRLLLECAYEALENAGIPLQAITGSRMGVFTGFGASDYRRGALRDMESVPIFDATGNQESIQAGRLSHFFNLRGPCMAIDTACSSSLYALHLAVQSIRSGEADSALVSGTRLRLYPEEAVSMSMMGLYNEEGKTFAFDDRAVSGFACGEGLGCVVLKPLDRALEDNDTIYSVIRSTGLNHDGRTVGLTNPNGEAQEELMREVYARANLSPEETGFVEAHGTGTKVGDPIEVGAIHRVFKDGRTKRAPLYIGSAKSNFGHLESASGIVSLIKASLMLHRGFILPNANFERANPAIPLDQWNIRVPTSLRPWPPGKKYISINNFSFGGSNCHVVLERPPRSRGLPPDTSHDAPRLFVLSGYDDEAAKRIARNLVFYLEQHPGIFERRLVHDVAYTLGERRSHFPWRLAVTASSTAELVEILNGPASVPQRARLGAGCSPAIAFAYTGQGAQWPRMGLELTDTHPVFAAAMEDAARALEELGADFSLLEELKREAADSRVSQPQVSQVVCTAVQLALTDLLASWGIHPKMVVGHSSGEIGAAYAAGALSVREAIALAYHRGRLAAQVRVRFPELNGCMMAVGENADEVRRTIKHLQLGEEDITVACENSPRSTTVSGDATAMDLLAKELEARQIFHRTLHVDVAYHSPHMQRIAEDYTRAIQQVAPSTKKGDVQFYSSLLGKKVEQPETLGASYWVNNLTHPVQFSTALGQLCTESTPDIIIEIGPHAALQGPIKQILQGMHNTQTQYSASLVRNEHATKAALQLAGRLFVAGQPLNFRGVNPIHQGHRVAVNHRLPRFPRHDLLGRLEPTVREDEQPVWRNSVSLDSLPWLRGHRMQSLTTFPMAGYVSMAVEAASQRAQLRGLSPSQIAGYRLREFHVSSAFTLEENVEYETWLSLSSFTEGTRTYSSEWDEFRIASWTASRGWREHCRGLVGIRRQETSTNPVSQRRPFHAALQRRHEATQGNYRSVPLEAFYADLEERGAGYSGGFNLQAESGLAVQKPGANGISYAHGRVAVPNTADSMPSGHETPSIVSPPFLDLCFQLIFAVLGAKYDRIPCLYMPISIQELDLAATCPAEPGAVVEAQANGLPADASRPRPIDFTIDAWAPTASTEQPVLTILGLRMTPMNTDIPCESIPHPWCYTVQWEPLSWAGQANRSGHSVDPETIEDGHTDGHGEVNGNAIAPINGTPSSSNGDHHTLSADQPTVVIIIITERSSSDPLIAFLVKAIKAFAEYEVAISPLSGVPVSSAHRYISLVELDTPVLQSLTPESFRQVQKLLLNCSYCLWVTSGAYLAVEHPGLNLSQGLLRSVRSEIGNAAVSLDLDPSSGQDVAGRAHLILDAFKASTSPGPNAASEEEEEEEAPVTDYEFTEVGGRLMVPRLAEQSALNTALFQETHPSLPYAQDFDQGTERRLKIAVGTLGALDSLYWTDDLAQPLGADEIEIKVACTGANFKDVVIAMGQVASPYLGIECSGTVARVGAHVDSLKPGDRVCAMTHGAYSTYARCPATSAAVIPDSMTLETAASIPVTYCTAHYGLVELAKMEAGESILIHAAAGGVGQAAIQLAQLIGAEIYATVGSEEKKQMLIERYGIPASRIFYSRNTEFGHSLRDVTDGRGVDVVLNSLAGDFLRETWGCLAPFGRFIEIGKRDITSNTRLEMAKFEDNCTFASVDLTLVADRRGNVLRRVFTTVMRMFAQGRLSPVHPVTTVGIAEVESVLRKLQSGKTTGKVVVDHRLNGKVKATHPLPSSELLSSDATYLIVGGTGGIGQSLTRRMVQRGARHVVLLSRSGTVSEAVQKVISECQTAGASIYIKKCDVSEASQVKATIAELVQKGLPPIRGVIHAAMVLKDILFEQMTFPDWDAVLRPKVAAAWNLHNALLHQPLDFFVMLSSVAGIIGNRGQAAYAAGNCFLDALAGYRRQKGLSAVSLDLAAVGDIGVLSDDADRKAQVMKNLASGHAMQEVEVLALVEMAMQGHLTTLNAEQCITGVYWAPPSPTPYYASDARFTPLVEAAKQLEGTNGDNASSTKSLSLTQQVRRAANLPEALEIAAIGLRDKLGEILMLPREVLEAHTQSTPIATFGLDSLNAIELRNWIGKELMAHMQILELLSAGVLGDLARLVLKKSTLEGAWKEELSH
ncbi:type I Iterative Polyketide synthase (PKS) [Aspergillus brasiliensis]|uniref:Type I Iterative Polyketide synthase (PKS) n=1 Tax=Aspergillus brasiliensis TaxID=319629 RepID=A0A9W6DKL1_9EURO|nr:type I Iterative Polyketide synthase (PKS) [Aspergillus brasiliensis]GKZ51707.1 type I Iterative Polyketide synthase (PKS) [Aspergillus brasiliensis]